MRDDHVTAHLARRVVLTSAGECGHSECDESVCEHVQDVGTVLVTLRCIPGTVYPRYRGPADQRSKQLINMTQGKIFPAAGWCPGSSHGPRLPVGEEKTKCGLGFKRIAITSIY